MPRSQNCHARGKWAPSWPPRRGWQDKTALCLKETRDNEIIFNLCPFEALPAPVILDGTARKGALHIHTKPGNYCTNYSLLMLGGGGGGVWLPAPGSGEQLVCSRASWGWSGPLVNSCSTPFSLADIWPLVMFAICTFGKGGGAKKQPQNF